MVHLSWRAGDAADANHTEAAKRHMVSASAGVAPFEPDQRLEPD
jgi:hypothetical protein